MARAERPIGLATGLLAGSGVTLIGVWRDLAPDVILYRAVVAGAVCGAMAFLLRLVFKSPEGK